MNLVLLRATRRSALGPHEIVLENLVLAGSSLRSGLIAPPTASQAFVPEEASEHVNIWWDIRGSSVPPRLLGNNC